MQTTTSSGKERRSLRAPEADCPGQKDKKPEIDMAKLSKRQQIKLKRVEATRHNKQITLVKKIRSQATKDKKASEEREAFFREAEAGSMMERAKNIKLAEGEEKEQQRLARVIIN